MERLNLNYLRALTVLLQERHVSRAAQELHLTQSAMSRQLAALRSHFDDPLLVREGQEYLLTAKAQRLKQQVEDILNQIDQLKGEPQFDPLSCQRSFQFACTDYVAQFIFPEVLTQLAVAAPNIDIDYRIWQPQWLDQLGQLSIDLASTMGDQLPAHVHALPLGEDQPVCLMSDRHPLASQPTLSLTELTHFKHVHISSGGDKDSFVDLHLAQHQLQRRKAFTVPFFSAGFNVLAHSDMLMVVPRHIAQNAQSQYSLCHKPLPLPVPTHRYFMIWHSIHHHDAAHRWLRELLAKVISDSIYSPNYDLKS